MDEPYFIRVTRSQQHSIVTLFAKKGFLVIHCVGEPSISKATERCVALYKKKVDECVSSSQVAETSPTTAT